MPDVPEHPTLGTVYVDDAGRELTVNEVNIGDPLGREVIGGIRVRPNSLLRDYACTLVTWAKVWRDKAPRTPVSAMKIG